MEQGSREAEREGVREGVREGARVRASVSVSDRLREREIRRPGKDDADYGAAAAAEGVMVLVELAWLSRTFGADDMFSFVSGLGMCGGGGSIRRTGSLAVESAGLGRDGVHSITEEIGWVEQPAE
jgi:hypothetical protein